MLSRLLLIFLLFDWSVASVTKRCPQDCTCDLDDPVGRIRVTCKNGGFVGPLDLSQVSTKTEVLIFTAPENNFNSLMIGPIFGKLKNIQEIHITRSNIPEIGEHSFWLLPTLEILDLRENNITRIVDENFRGITNLQKLYLDENRIDGISSGTFRYMQNLKVLSLSNNRMHMLVTRIFEGLKKLQELNLNGNRLTELNPEAFIDIPTLKILECRACSLKTINNDFFHLIPNLQILDFGENNFKYITPDDFKSLPNLRFIWLDQNKISVLHQKAFAAQSELRKLNLSKNKINLISNSAFENLSRLIDLNLADNKLRDLDEKVLEPFAMSLERLELGGNEIPISEIKMCLKNLRRLQHLGLNNLDLGELPLGLFDFNKNLSSLNLAGNHFAFFPIGALSPVPNLNDLDISRNKLRGLDDQALLRIESINFINFQHNPWSCDLCHIIPMLEKMNVTALLQNVVCKNPFHLQGIKLGDLQFEQLRRCTTISEQGLTKIIHQGQLGLISLIAGVILVIITSVLIIGGYCYKRRHARHYYTNEEKRNLENDPICDTTPELTFIENGEISFKFPLDEKISIAIIDDIKKDPIGQTNGT